jgi:hypothetical protein
MEGQERDQLLESIGIQFPTEEDVGDEELVVYLKMIEGANVLVGKYTTQHYNYIKK